MTAVAESYATNVAAEASKGIFGIVKQEVDYCFRCKKYVKDFKTELVKLESTLEDANDRERRARNNNEEISNVGMNWLKGARDLKDAADRLKKKTEEQSKCVIAWHPNCICRYVIGKKAADMTPKLKCQITDFKPENFSHPASLSIMELHAPTNFVYLDSRKVAFDEAWKALQDNQKLRIGVHGLGGLGKTTLVKELGHRAEKEKLFDKVVFVAVSNTVVVGKIQDSIANQLGLTLKCKQVSERASELWKRLKQEEKILIILDDVWERLDLTAIGIPLGDMNKGCRLLLTTREVDVCTSMECQAMIPLSFLSEEDSWKLFQKYVNISNDPTIPLGLAKEIAHECKSLPVAITTMASSLKGQKPRKWKVALKTLKDAKPLTRIPEHLKDFYNSFSFCYDNLNSEEFQELLLFCSFFPEDYRIPIEILTRYAIGLDLFKYDGSYEDIRDRVKEAIEELDSRLLLHANKDVHGEYVKMHDLVRETAQWKKNRDIMEMMGSKVDEEAMDRARYLWFHKTNDLPNQLNFPKLEIPVIPCETKDYAIYFVEKQEIFKGLEKLRVLILTWEIGWTNPFRIKLPTSINVLESLRVLRLKRWSWGDISVIGSLSNLEVLELYSCEIDELPSAMVEFKNFKL